MAWRCLNPQVHHVETIGILETTGVLRHAFLRIDVSQRIGFERERWNLAGDSKQRGRSAEHHRQSAQYERPAVASGCWDQEVDKGRIRGPGGRALGAKRRSQQ